MIINCKAISSEIKENAIHKYNKWKEHPYFVEKHLAIAHLVSDDKASIANESYIKSIQRTFSDAGIPTKVYKVDLRKGYMGLSELATYLRELRVPTVVVSDDSTEKSLLEATIPYEYILDSSHFGNFHYPCVVDAVNKVLLKTGFKKGTITVIGRGEAVGKPMVQMLMNLWNGATISSCNSKTPNLASYTAQSDVVISCVGKPNLVNRDLVKRGTVIIDVGYSSANGKMVGDCQAGLEDYCDVTPVQSGIGLITRAILLERFVKAVTPNE